MRKVKLVSLKVNGFGMLEAAELNFESFKNGIIAVKGNAGSGKSSTQKAIKTVTAGSKTLADTEMYGDEWDIEVQLSDGDRKIFSRAQKKEGQSPKFTLFEIDEKGRKCQNPVIDGVKATPAEYFKVITNELTFGTNVLLSESNTTQMKFMFELFKPELKKLGIIFNKSSDQYKTSPLGILDELTEIRDNLRTDCRHRGCFVTDFTADGVSIEDIEGLTHVDITTLQNKITEATKKKIIAETGAETVFLKAQNEINDQIAVTIEEIRKINVSNVEKHNQQKKKFEEQTNKKASLQKSFDKFSESISELKEIVTQDNLALMRSVWKQIDKAIKEIIPIEPKTPVGHTITNGKLLSMQTLKGAVNSNITPQYTKLLQDYITDTERLEALKSEPVDVSSINVEIVNINSEIARAKIDNDYIERLDINRAWVEADAKVTIKRKEIQSLYSQIDTGVEGLNITPFFDESAKMTLKTTYNGCYDPAFFRNKDKDNRILNSYSSTQKPLIALLLQVSRIKLKEKVLEWMFLDDVPMDRASYAIITRLATENGLKILTSITGDFKQSELQSNELLIENGKVLFSKN